MIYKMTLTDSSDTMTFNLLETPIVDKDIEGAVDNVTLDGNQYTDYLYLKKQYIQKWAIMCPDEYDELRGFYTRQFEEGEIPLYRVYYGANVTKDYIYNGDYFQFNAKGIETGMYLSKLNGNATQNGTPTPDAPVSIETVTGENTVKIWGKNLFDKNASPAFIQNNAVEFEALDTGIRAKTLAVGSNIFGVFIIGQSRQFLNKTLTVQSIMSANASNTPRIYIGLCDAAGQNRLAKVVLASTGSASYTHTTESETSPYLCIAIYANSGGTVQVGDYADYTNLQLELGSQATAYEPYQSQSHEVNLGKNLSSVSSLSNLTWGNNSNDFKDVLNSLGAGTYTFSCKFTLTARNDQTDASKYGIYFDNSTGQDVLERPQWGAVGVGATATLTKTFTIAEAQVGNFTNAYFYGCGVTGATGKADATEIQIEKGSTATTYAPYFTPIELCKIGTYQDRIYKSANKWYLHKEVGKKILDGSEAWTAGQGGTLRLFYGAQYPDILLTNQRQNFLSNNFHFIASGNETGAGFIYQQRFYLYYGDMNTTATDFKTWLSTHPTTVYYALATATDTEITEQALIDDLNQVWTLFGGVNNIMLIPTSGAQGTMEVLIRDVLDVERDVVPETPVRLTLTDGGVINACGCRRDVQLTMRETTE